MKKVILLITCLLLLPLSKVYGSKARTLSLQGAYFLKDIQYTFLNPAQIHDLPNFLTYELGGTTNTSNPKAEGGLIKNYGKAKAGIYLGHMDANQSILRSANSFQNEENPVDIFYGQNNWAINVSYSNTDKKTTDESQQRIAAKYGMNGEKVNFFIHTELISKADKGDDSYSSFPLITIGGEHNLSKDIYTFAKLTMGDAKQKISDKESTTKVTDFEFIIFDRSLKTKKSSIYFGPSVQYQVAEVSGDKRTETRVPFYIGFEYQLKSWMELRSSISQNVIFGSTKDDTASSPADEEDTIDNNTTVTVGTGLKFDDIVIDGVFAGSTNGNLNSNTFLANIAITFNF